MYIRRCVLRCVNLLIKFTQGIMPNPEEMVAIGNLTDAQYALVTEDNSTRLGEEELNPVCTDPEGDLNLPPIPGVTPSPNCIRMQKRQADIMILSDCMLLIL